MNQTKKNSKDIEVKKKKEPVVVFKYSEKGDGGYYYGPGHDKPEEIGQLVPWCKPGWNKNK